MRELLDMQKEIMAEQSKRDFNAAFIALQRELPTIRRDGKIEIREKVAGERVGRVQQATPYATFNAIMGAIKPLLVKHGFALSFETEPMAERLLVKGRLEGHGHERTTAFPLPAETSGSKNNVQGWGSSMSYGKRYCTIALLNIISEAQEDRDTDGNENKPTLKDAKGGGFVEVPDRPKVTEEQAIALRDLIEWCGVGTRKFVEHYGIKTVADLAGRPVQRRREGLQGLPREPADPRDTEAPQWSAAPPWKRRLVSPTSAGRTWRSGASALSETSTGSRPAGRRRTAW
jgi:hypothetical protein